MELATWVPDARFDAVSGLSDATGVATIEVTRSLADALDGVDLATAGTESLSWHVLHRLTGRAALRVR